MILNIILKEWCLEPSETQPRNVKIVLKNLLLSYTELIDYREIAYDPSK